MVSTKNMKNLKRPDSAWPYEESASPQWCLQKEWNALFCVNWPHRRECPQTRLSRIQIGALVSDRIETAFDSSASSTQELQTASITSASICAAFTYNKSHDFIVSTHMYASTQLNSAQIDRAPSSCLRALEFREAGAASWPEGRKFGACASHRLNGRTAK